jgi:hypothetical protein
MQSQSKSQQDFTLIFVEIINPMLKFVWKCKAPRIAKAIDGVEN